MAIAGKNGKLQIGWTTPVTVVGIKNCSLDLALDTLETTMLGSDWKEYITGLKELATPHRKANPNAIGYYKLWRKERSWHWLIVWYNLRMKYLVAIKKIISVYFKEAIITKSYFRNALIMNCKFFAVVPRQWKVKR